MNKFILRQFLLNGKMVLELDLFQYRHVWLSPYILAVEHSKSWVLYEVLKYEPDTLIVREVGSKSSLEEVEACLREYSLS